MERESKETIFLTCSAHRSAGTREAAPNVSSSAAADGMHNSRSGDDEGAAEEEADDDEDDAAVEPGASETTRFKCASAG